ncbi:hypothetical protein ANO11243_027390 [Dothideomycetidae sp. 11243]|nr:hypothetical protein ANO11243_027390 [fungal sp. No.11243]
MHPTALFTAVVAAFVTQRGIAAAVPLKGGESGGLDPNPSGGPEHHALLTRDPTALLERRGGGDLSAEEVTKLVRGCIPAGDRLSLSMWKKMPEPSKKKITKCGVKVVNKAYKKAGKSKNVDESQVEKDVEDGLKKLGEVKGTGADL